MYGMIDYPFEYDKFYKDYGMSCFRSFKKEKQFIYPILISEKITMVSHLKFSSNLYVPTAGSMLKHEKTGTYNFNLIKI